MSRYAVKVNAAGSWANLVSCPPERLEAVKAACEQLASACDHGLAFKVIDCKTEQVTEMYNSRPRAGEPYGWHIPKKT